MCDVLHCLVEVFFLIAYNTIGTIWNYCLVLLNSRSKQLGVIEPVVRNGLITVLQTSSALVSHKDPVSGQMIPCLVQYSKNYILLKPSCR